jgi:hypothetical protein
MPLYVVHDHSEGFQMAESGAPEPGATPPYSRAKR